jgi:hypothetical protein
MRTVAKSSARKVMDKPSLTAARAARLDLASYLQKSLVWTATGDLEYPWKTELAGEALSIRLNDFPEQQMYTLWLGNHEVASFDDWPSNWRRPSRIIAGPARRPKSAGTR